MRITIISVFFLFCLVSFSAWAGSVHSFPGAEGYGSQTVGGRGGRVIFVSNLNDSGAGSFRAACEASGARTVVFRVGGIIELKSYLDITKPYLTIAGQTAPGDGICFKNYGIYITADEVIMRYITIRAGTEHHGGDDALWVRACENVIVDHVTTSWGNDETLSVTVTSMPPHKLKNVTVQWCIISEGMNTHDFWGHSMGSGIDAKGGLSFHHNLYAHNKRRNPRMGSWPGHYVNFDFRNNVIYNWNVSGFSGPDNEGTINPDFPNKSLQKDKILIV